MVVVCGTSWSVRQLSIVTLTTVADITGVQRFDDTTTLVLTALVRTVRNAFTLIRLPLLISLLLRSVRGRTEHPIGLNSVERAFTVNSVISTSDRRLNTKLIVLIVTTVTLLSPTSWTSVLPVNPLLNRLVSVENRKNGRTNSSVYKPI